MKISTNKIKAIGSGILLANIMTGVFAAPSNVFTQIDAADYYNLPQVTMAGGMAEQTDSIPTIQLSGGQVQQTYTLTPTTFLDGQDEVISSIDQITMGSGIDYEEFTFSQVQMGSTNQGVTYKTYELSPEVLHQGVNEEYFNFGAINLENGQEETTASNVMNIFPSGMHWQTQFEILDENDIVLLSYPVDQSRTLNSVVDDINGLNLGFTVVRTDGPILTATATTSGSTGNLNFGWKLNFLNYLTNTSDSASTPFSLIGGQDEVSASGSVTIDSGYSKLGVDRFIEIDGNSFSVSTNDDFYKSPLEVANRIETRMNEIGLNTVSVSVDDSDINNPVVTFTSISNNPWESRALTIEDGEYSKISAENAKYSVPIPGPLAENAADDELTIDDEIINLGMYELSPSEILSVIRSKTFLNFEDYEENGNLLLISNTPGMIDDVNDNPLIDVEYTRENGAYAQAEFTVTEALANNAQDNTLEVLGVTVTLGVTGNTVEDIATDIMKTVNSANNGYTISTSGTATVSITNNNFEVDTSDIFGLDNSYTTVNGVVAKSNVVSIPSGIQATSEDDLSITLAGKTITFSEGSTSSDIASIIDGEFNPSTDMYDVQISNGDEIRFVATANGVNTNNLFDLVSNTNANKYNAQDNKAASVSIDLSGISMPANADENELIIDSHTFNLGTLALDSDGIGNTIVSVDDQSNVNNFQNLISSYDESTNMLTFTTELEDEDANNFVLGSDLTFVTTNNEWASSTFTIPSPYSGTQLDSLVSTDNTLIIGSVLIDLGTAPLTEEEIALAIKTTLDNSASFSTMYTVTSNGANVNIEKNIPVADSTILNGGNDDYTVSNEVKSSGTLQITQPIVEGAEDKNVIIAGQTITFDDIDYTTETMAQFIADELTNANNANVRATAINGDVFFNSKLSDISGDGDIISEIVYNGRAQTTILTMSDLESGFTYDLGINGGTHSDIVTPQTNAELVFNEILSKIQQDSSLSVSLASNVITVSGPIEHNFDFTLNGASNAAPVASNVEVSELNLQSGTYTCEYTYSDENPQSDNSTVQSDIEGLTEFSWYANGNLLSEQSEILTLNSNSEDKTINCEVTPKAQTGVKTGESVMSTTDMKTPLHILELSDGDMFSIPVGVHSQKMLDESNINMTTDNFNSYLDGSWDNFVFTDFAVLLGYRYDSSDELKTLYLPIYVDEDYDFTNTKTKIDNDFNLIGLNSVNDISAGEFLESLTLKSNTEQLVNSIYSSSGSELGTYNKFYASFRDGRRNVYVEPYLSYWITYNGEDDKTFFGISGNDEDNFGPSPR
jgi:hypothetical protein